MTTNENDLDDDLDVEPQNTDTRLAAVERRLALSEIENSYGLDSKQATKVYDLAKTAGLASQEAIAVLRERREAGFETAPEATFGSLSPRPGSYPRQKIDEVAERKKQRDGLRMTNRKEFNRLLDHEMGGHLAEAMNWFHPLNPHGGN